MSILTKVVSHAVNLGHHVAHASVSVGKHVLSSAKEHIARAKEHLNEVESGTGLQMPEFHEHLNGAEEALNKKPPAWDEAKKHLDAVMDLFKQKL